MPNRIIKESICTSRKIDLLTAEEENFFYRLLVNCDDYGCFFAEPEILASKLYPRRRLSPEAAGRIRDRLSEVGLIALYESEGETYLYMPSWGEHQRLRKAKHRFPEPPPREDGAMYGVESSSQNVENTVGSISPQLAATCGEIPPSRARAESESQSESEYESESELPQGGKRPGKRPFAEFVSLTNEEWSSLVAKLGVEGAKRCVEILDNYKGASGKRYDSDYRAILNWVVGRYREEEAKKPRASGRSYDLEEFEQRGFHIPKITDRGGEQHDSGN